MRAIRVLSPGSRAINNQRKHRSTDGSMDIFNPIVELVGVMSFCSTTPNISFIYHRLQANIRGSRCCELQFPPHGRDRRGRVLSLLFLPTSVNRWFTKTMLRVVAEILGKVQYGSQPLTSESLITTSSLSIPKSQPLTPSVSPSTT